METKYIMAFFKNWFTSDMYFENKRSINLLHEKCIQNKYIEYSTKKFYQIYPSYILLKIFIWMVNPKILRS